MLQDLIHHFSSNQDQFYNIFLTFLFKIKVNSTRSYRYI